MGKSISRWITRAMVVAVALFAGAQSAMPGDAVVARTLLESGKKAFAAKKYDDAIPLFKKAVAEDPALVEAVYWRAQVHEKLKQEPAALAAYREFLLLVAGKSDATPEEQKLRPLAEKRVDALAVADREFQKLEEKYAADLLAIAKAHVASDPGAALLAANKILEAIPKHPEALALRDRLGGKKDEGPFAGVVSWRDVLGNQEFRSDTITYTDGVMGLPVKIGAKLRPEPPATMSADCAGEMEFRVPEAYEQMWAVGFFLGETKDSHYGVLVERAQVKLTHQRPKEKYKTLISFAMAPIDPAAWHRLAFVARGTQIQVFLDGEMVIDKVATAKADCAGDVGVLQVTCRSEIRKFRIGSFE